LIIVSLLNIKGIFIVKKNIIIAISFIAITGLTYVNYFQVTSFEGCLLKQMKSQDKNLMHVAARLCERKFPKPDA
jgi:hypothetical protein